MCALSALGGLVVLVARHPGAARSVRGSYSPGWRRHRHLRRPRRLPALRLRERAVPFSGPAPDRRHRGLPHDVGVVVLPEQPGAVRDGRYVRPRQRPGRGNSVEHAVYLGVPLLCILCSSSCVAGVWESSSSMSLVALGSWVVTLGPFLYIGLTPHPQIHLPYDLIKHIPLINAGIDVRYSLIMYLAVAVVLAVGLDRWWLTASSAPGAGWRQRLAGPRTATPWAGAGLGAGVAVIGLVPLVPSLPYTSTVFGVPNIFTAAGSPIHNGDVVLSYPLPVGLRQLRRRPGPPVAGRGRDAFQADRFPGRRGRSKPQAVGERRDVAAPDGRGLAGVGPLWTALPAAGVRPDDLTRDPDVPVPLRRRRHYHRPLRRTDGHRGLRTSPPPWADPPSDFQGTYVWSGVPQLLAAQ